MKKQLSISLIFDFPAVLSPFGFFDIGTDKVYLDSEQNADLFKVWYSNQGEAQLNELVETVQNGKHISAYFSEEFLAQLSHLNEALFEDLKIAISSGNLTLIGGLSSPTLASIYSESQFKRQIETHKKALLSYFGVSPAIFYNTENIYFQRLDELVYNAGYKSIFAGTIDWYLSYDPNRRIFKANNGLNILLLDNHNELSVFDSASQSPCFFQADSSSLTQLGGLNAVLKNVEKVADLVPISEQVKGVKSDKTYNIKNPSTGSIRGFSLDAYNGNVLQNQILRQYYQLESKLMLLKDDSLITTWDQLGHAENIRQMGSTEINGQENPHALYSHFSNILTDLEIRVDH